MECLKGELNMTNKSKKIMMVITTTVIIIIIIVFNHNTRHPYQTTNGESETMVRNGIKLIKIL
jgi:ABC-type cobalt transport system substrate-binding protein